MNKINLYQLFAVFILALILILGANQNPKPETPETGVSLPAEWGDLGLQLSEKEVIDADKIMAIYRERGDFTAEQEAMLRSKGTGPIKITAENSGYLLNLFWALGLANQNPILTSGEMSDPRYGDAGRFASTGGWTLAKGDPMSHYNRHQLLRLTPTQQALVAKMAQGIYRPCCDNSTHFPDCNHGMAMLGLLELMASQGASETEMWATALAVNAYWFPEHYSTIAVYYQQQGIEWSEIDPREALGVHYSSAQGFARIASQVARPKQDSVGCAV
ncbi:MAG: hypothetical protein COV08_02280 [Candidatus Vogelbacteria bacterium CG10_big_fil_rev_8_21_14_0_10_49_38]|uniref:Uncharacterized protein n=1 Tax=Candidatus Vogelbacteria bacterium CG10_big_fil_rev_8_21_14_0_10_49_38 TaxID=1975043 RepID=A0A2H0RHQ9_9BACT|nr:MAG: hypothetical protein BK006_02300 [bacterium CG10_49_38]PIR45966.1 MAG: hypothetical protein COV08_02280 [Candidatus Vogelbacteria bacterium CG10_big_fil_rev_8_21_14_0_10_49_38]